MGRGWLLLVVLGVACTRSGYQNTPDLQRDVAVRDAPAPDDGFSDRADRSSSPELAHDLRLKDTALKDLAKDLVLKDVAKDLAPKDTPATKDQAKDKATKDVAAHKDLPPKDLPPKDLPPKDLLPKDLPPKDLPPKDLLPKDLLQKDKPSTKDMSLNPNGTFGIAPTAAYQCALGLVNFSIDQASFVDSGVKLTATIGPVGPGGGCNVLTGDTAYDGSFSVTCTYPGTCAEVYTLTGTFANANSWTGSFTATFTGSCLNCVNKVWAVTGTRK